MNTQNTTKRITRLITQEESILVFKQTNKKILESFIVILQQDINELKNIKDIQSNNNDNLDVNKKLKQILTRNRTIRQNTYETTKLRTLNNILLNSILDNNLEINNSTVENRKTLNELLSNIEEVTKRIEVLDSYINKYVYEIQAYKLSIKQNSIYKAMFDLDKIMTKE